MKKIFKLMMAVSSIVVVMNLSSCKKGNDPTAKEVNTKILIANSWKVSSVTVDGVDKTTLFTGMTLKFDATNYTTINGGVVWPASGTWSFVDEEGKLIKRSDDQQITVMEISDANLKLALTRTQGTFGPGRTGSVSGNHVFNFVKQ